VKKFITFFQKSHFFKKVTFSEKSENFFTMKKPTFLKVVTFFKKLQLFKKVVQKLQRISENPLHKMHIFDK